jgi:cardiolipin synthase
MWALLGSPIPAAARAALDGHAEARGNTALRVVASFPNTGSLYRFDQLICALARKTIWLTDAYFLGTAPYVQALRAAAEDGVDVRLLLPSTSDVPVVSSFSRAGYRTLLEAGVRLFEWNGPMLHAKTAVADGRWARVGSSNLNVASWLGNWEIDVVVEDTAFATQMEQMYLDDLGHSTEIVLTGKRKVYRARARLHRHNRGSGVAGGAMTGLLRVGNTVGAAITSRRSLGPAEWGGMFLSALALLGMALLGAFWPRTIATPVIMFAVWVAIALLIRVYKIYKHRDE